MPTNVEVRRIPVIPLAIRDENGSDTDGYHRYYICFHISVRIRIRIRIVLTISDRKRLDIDFINIRFEYSDMNTISDIEYLDSDTDRFKPQKIFIPFSPIFTYQTPKRNVMIELHRFMQIRGRWALLLKLLHYFQFRCLVPLLKFNPCHIGCLTLI